MTEVEIINGEETERFPDQNTGAEFATTTMGAAEFCFCLRARRPRLFLIFCCLFSVALGAMSSIFFYYPEGVNLPPVYAPDGLVVQQHHHQKDRVEYLSGGVHHRLINSGVKGGRPMSSDRSGMNFDSAMNDQEDYSSGSAADKIRHPAHHFDQDMMEVEDGEGEKVILPVGDLEEKSIISNVVESRLIHFDLKGAPPKISYLKEVS